MQFRKLKQADADKQRAAKDGGQSLVDVPRGEHAAFDQFTDLLDHGAEVATSQRKWLVGVPVVAMFLSGGTFGGVAYMVFAEGFKGDYASAAEVVKDNGYLVQLAIVSLCFTMICLCSSIAPTSIKQIYCA